MTTPAFCSPWLSVLRFAKIHVGQAVAEQFLKRAGNLPIFNNTVGVRFNAVSYTEQNTALNRTSCSIAHLTRGPRAPMRTHAHS